MENKDGQTVRRETVTEYVEKDANEAINQPGEVHETSGTNRIVRKQSTSEVNQNESGEGAGSEDEGEETPIKRLATEYNFENAYAARDPNETRTQLNEHWRFNSPTLQKQGHF